MRGQGRLPRRWHGGFEKDAEREHIISAVARADGADEADSRLPRTSTCHLSPSRLPLCAAAPHRTQLTGAKNNLTSSHDAKHGTGAHWH